MSPRSRRFGVPAAWATGLGLTVLACSSNSAHPPELGDCVKVGDASCPVPDPGGGGGAGPGDGGGTDTGTEDALTGCGTAQDLLTSQNASCVPCVEGTAGTGLGCCGADQACSAQGDCLTLLRCMSACALTDSLCADTCENDTPGGVQAYNQLAQCISQNCTPECAALPQGDTGDL